MSLEYKPRLKVKYGEEVVPHLSSHLGISNPMRVPKLVKVVLNVGMGDAKDNSNWLKNKRNKINQTLLIEKELDEIKEAPF